MAHYLVIYQGICEYTPMIVAVLGEKGGTGKTTLATNLAGMRAAEGRDV
jgi:cellulose biosynthesis protein BcsQ